VRIEPHDDGGTAVWHHRDATSLAIGVWTERRLARGEDAEPLFVHHVPTGKGVAGVFDGAGGAGASAAYEADDGTARSGAWVAARTSRAAVESWFCEHVEQGAMVRPDVLRIRLGDLLTTMRPSTRRRVVGTMTKDLPTTMAVVSYCLRGHDVDCHAMWAGDSRAYVLTPDHGLQALTRDHTEETDALAQLRQDPPMTNMLSAGSDFIVDSHILLLPRPCVLVCATDGFFGYVDTPAHFECHLLNALHQAFDEGHWSRLLAAKVRSYTADDASLSLVALGFGDFARLRTAFARRRSTLLREYDKGRFDLRDPAAERDWTTMAWHRYRSGYEQRMPPLGNEPR